MRLGKIKYYFIIIFFASSLHAEDKILSAPIINLENLEPSYENLENDKEVNTNLNTKIKKRKVINLKYVHV